MKIKEIQEGMRNIEVTGRVVEVGEVRKVMTRYGPARVATAKIEDETGSIRLNLWRDQIDIVKAGDTVRLQNAFVKTFQGEKELNIGRDGNISVVG